MAVLANENIWREGEPDGVGHGSPSLLRMCGHWDKEAPRYVGGTKRQDGMFWVGDSYKL